MTFVLFRNTLLYLDILSLAHGEKGVPIAGFMSAQVTELWAWWREFRFLVSPPHKAWHPGPTPAAGHGPYKATKAGHS